MAARRPLLLALLPALLLALTALGCGREADVSPADVRVTRVPDGGLQPRAVTAPDGTLHLVYFSGDPAAGDLYHVRRAPGDTAFSAPVRVNDRPGAAVAIGTIRGAQAALGPDGRLHVLWNGSGQTAEAPHGAPLLYTRQRDDGHGFEPARDLIRRAGHLDGGGALAVDADDRVYAFWHGSLDGGGEASRAVYLARSDDGGRRFAEEVRVSPAALGACACCGMQALAAPGGGVAALYRAAREGVHRDMILLTAEDGAASFAHSNVGPWELESCPMSSAALAAYDGGVLAAWQTGEQLYLARTGAAVPAPGEAVPFPGEGVRRKHPSLAVAPDGRTLLAYTEETAWAQGGRVAWQVLGPDGTPLAAPASRDDLPVWSFAAAVADADGRFEVIY